MHFVKLTGLKPRGKYVYKVSSGTPNAVTSQLFTFTAPYDSGVTKLGIFGDMGVFQYNNMGNLLDDYTSGKIDLIVHMGGESTQRSCTVSTIPQGHCHLVEMASSIDTKIKLIREKD